MLILLILTTKTPWLIFILLFQTTLQCLSQKIKFKYQIWTPQWGFYPDEPDSHCYKFVLLLLSCPYVNINDCFWLGIWVGKADRLVGLALDPFLPLLALLSFRFPITPLFWSSNSTLLYTMVKIFALNHHFIPILVHIPSWPHSNTHFFKLSLPRALLPFTFLFCPPPPRIPDPTPLYPLPANYPNHMH